MVQFTDDGSGVGGTYSEDVTWAHYFDAGVVNTHSVIHIDVKAFEFKDYNINS